MRPWTLLRCERAQGGGAHVRPDDGTRAHAVHLADATHVHVTCACTCTCNHVSTHVVWGIALHVQVLSSVFSTLLVFNLIIASRILGEAVTPPKVAGALLILAGAGISTGATPQGVPKAYTPADVRALLFAPPPYGWIVPLLFGVCVLVSIVGIPLLERRFPLGTEGELEPELVPAIERRMSTGPGEIGEHLARSLSPRRRHASKERWSTNTGSDSNSSPAWRAFMEGSSVASEAGAMGAACEAGTSSGVDGHDCSVNGPRLLVLPSGSPVWASYGRQPEPPPAAAPAPAGQPTASPRADPLPPASPTTLGSRQPSSSPRLARPPPEPRSCAHLGADKPKAGTAKPTAPEGAEEKLPPSPPAPTKPRPREISLPDDRGSTPHRASSPVENARKPRACHASAPSEGSAARPAARPPFAWLLGERTPRPLPAWADPLVATGYAAALGVDEALADLCVRAYSSMLTTCDRPAAGCWEGWELYSFAFVGSAAGLASALFYMPLVYRRYEITARSPHKCNTSCST